MSERLTNERLDALMIIDSNVALSRESAAELRAMALELRMRRAADLSAEDVEALAWARGFVSNAVPEHCNPACYPMRALSVLDRIINGGGR